MDNWLATNGFLPGYAFESEVVWVQFENPEDDFAREPSIAIREFGPDAICYAHKNRWRVREAVLTGTQDHLEFKRCHECGQIYCTQNAEKPRCRCGADVGLQFIAMRMPNVRVARENKITRWEEIRESRSFVIEEFAELTIPAQSREFSGSDERKAVLSFYSECEITTINFRSKFAKKSETGGRSEVYENLLYRPGYKLENGKWILRQLDDSGDDSDWKAIYVTGQHNALLLEIEPVTEKMPDFQITLRNALNLGLSLALRQGPEEIRSLDIHSNEPQKISILFYEATSGSSGALKRVFDEGFIVRLVNHTLEALHYGPDGNDLMPECTQACYQCLLNFNNQREHKYMNRKLVLDTLLLLKNTPAHAPDDSKWETLIKSIPNREGAANEKKFLQMIKEAGLPVPKKHHYPIPEDNPIAEIDYMLVAGKNIVHVLVDGSMHHNKWIKQIDQIRREAIRDAGYQIFEFDMSDPEESLRKLKELLTG
ncbi:MAG: DUF1998 domain-containing protein [Armatimonadota bacterium]